MLIFSQIYSKMFLGSPIKNIPHQWFFCQKITLTWSIKRIQTAKNVVALHKTFSSFFVVLYNKESRVAKEVCLLQYALHIYTQNTISYALNAYKNSIYKIYCSNGIITSKISFQDLNKMVHHFFWQIIKVKIIFF